MSGSRSMPTNATRVLVVDDKDENLEYLLGPALSSTTRATMSMLVIRVLAVSYAVA